MTTKEWVRQHPLYVEVARQRDGLLAEVAELREALLGAGLAHRVERSVVELELAALRAENTALAEGFARLESESLKVTAVG